MAELLLVALVYTAGFYVWRNQVSLDVSSWFLVTGDGSAQLTSAGWWAALVSMPVFQFLMYHLLQQLGLHKRVVCTNPNVWTSFRTSGKRSSLFLINLLSAPMETHAYVFPTWHFCYIDTGPHVLPPMTVRVVEVSQSVIRMVG